MVARLLREQEVVGSSPVASTNVETRLFCKESAFYALSLLFVGFSSSPKARFRGSLFFQALFACLAFLLRKTHKKTKRRFGGCLADFFLRDVEFCDASGAFLPRCSVATAPCKSRRLDQRRNSTVLQRECVLRTLFAFCRFLLLPESSLSGFPFFISHFYLCCAPI